MTTPSIPAWVWAWALVGVVCVVALTTRTAALPSDGLGVRRFLVPIDETTTLSQTFVMTADRLHAIDVLAATTAEPVSGDLRFELYDISRSVVLVHRADVPAEDVVRAATYRLEFPLFEQSARVVYRLDVLASPSRPATGVALWATKGRRYAGGAMFINERERWADLAFTTISPAGRSIWRRLMDAPPARHGVPLGPVVIGALIGYWIALGVVLRLLA